MAWETVVLWFCFACFASADIPEDSIPMGPPGLMRRLDKYEMGIGISFQIMYDGLCINVDLPVAA